MATLFCKKSDGSRYSASSLGWMTYEMRFDFQQEQEMFLLLQSSKPALEPTQGPTGWVPRYQGLYPESKTTLAWSWLFIVTWCRGYACVEVKNPPPLLLWRVQEELYVL